MNKKLYVGGLSYDTTVAGLTEAFSQAGKIAESSDGKDPVVVITDRMTGRSKGFGFVEMASEEDAAKAIEMWNGKELDGRTLTVNEARPMEERPRRDGGFNRGGRGGFDSHRSTGQRNWQ